MANPFFRRGTTRVYFLPAAADLAAITVAEVAAGDELTEDIAEMTGFTFDNSPIPTPRLSNTFTPTIPGEDTSENSVLTFYEYADTNPHQVTLDKGTEGVVVIFFAGTAGATPAAADKYEAWPVVTSGWRREYSSGNDPARWSVTFGTSNVPEQNGVLAA